jgi:thioesterase domain-containing protein
MTELAERYVSELVEHQPTGPVHLVGVCQGAIVALEMARLLRARSREVATLVMIRPSSLVPFVGTGWGLDEICDYRVEAMAKRLSLRGDEDLAQIWAAFKAEEWYDDWVRPADLPRLQLVWSALTFALHHYAPRRYDGPALVVDEQATSDDTHAEWAGVLPYARFVSVDSGNSGILATVEHSEVAQHIQNASAG